MTADVGWIVLGAAVAGFVQGISGFAFSLVAMSIWVWVLDPQLATVLAIFGGMTGQWLSTITLRRGLHWSLLWPYLLGGLVGVPIGLALSPWMSSTHLMVVMGVTLVVFCPALLVAARMPRVHGGGWLADAAAGLGGGAMTAIGGFAGVIPTLWATLRGYPKDHQRAVIQNFNLAALTTTFLAMVVSGRVGMAHLPSLALVAPALVVPSMLGTKVYAGLSEQRFRQVVLWLLTSAGVSMLVTGLSRIMANATAVA